MSWLIYTLLGVALISIARLIDKFVDSGLKNPNVLSGFYGTGSGLVFVIAALIQGTALTFEPNLLILSVIAAFIIMKAKYFYYKALEAEEITKFIPLLALSPLIVLVVSFILGEKLTFNQVIGIILIFLGAFIASFKSIKHHFELSHVVKLGVAVAALFAIKNVLIKGIINQQTFWTIMLYYGAACALIGAFLVITSKHKIRNKAHKKEFTLAAYNSILMGFAMLLFNIALLMGSASIVSAISSTESILVVILVLIAHKTKLLELNENYNNAVVIRKLLAAIIAVVGTILLI